MDNQIVVFFKKLTSHNLLKFDRFQRKKLLSLTNDQK